MARVTTVAAIPSPTVGTMIPRAVREFIEHIVPWYDRAAEARRNERSQRIHDRSVAVLEGDRDRIRRAYRQYADGVKR